jgi:chemotaxis protein methyltransferase CheR
MTFDEFLRSVCPKYDLNWRKYRRRSARHRILARMRELRLESWQEYRELLIKNAAEGALFPDLMRVTVTRFFRDRVCWGELSGHLPSLIGLAPETVRVWSAGCCGGEEPYSLAVLWLEHLAPHHPEIQFDILATDIDEASLNRAQTARYHPASLREVPAELRDKWFEHQGDIFRPLPSVRRLVQFQKHNLLSDPPPEEIELLLCRYLPFTYFRGSRLEAAVDVFARALKPGGLLMIGLKEEFPEQFRRGFAPVGSTGALWRRV